MFRTKTTSKIHCTIVTQADLNCAESVTIDTDLPDNQEVRDYSPNGVFVDVDKRVLAEGGYPQAPAGSLDLRMAFAGLA